MSKGARCQLGRDVWFPDLLPWRVVGRSVGRSVRPSVNTCNSATNVRIFFKFGGNIPWVNMARPFFRFCKILNFEFLKKINFNFKKFKSSFSQNLPDRICSILAYSFLMMVLKHCKEVYTLKSL